ncbi:MAG: caspase family protein, partial [Elusimicrobiota bacterium]|nr:caspase family protein [Elusimicrobiota bacterium]
DAMFLKSTAYPLKSLYASLAKLKAKRVLVALDSCFSGAGGRSVLAEGARPLVTRTDEVEAPAGVTVLSAASGDEITATIKEQGHGAFTYYLLKAFNNGKLTAKAAYDELKPNVQDEAHRQNREQTPLLLGEDASF